MWLKIVETMDCLVQRNALLQVILWFTLAALCDPQPHGSPPDKVSNQVGPHGRNGKDSSSSRKLSNFLQLQKNHPSPVPFQPLHLSTGINSLKFNDSTVSSSLIPRPPTTILAPFSASVESSLPQNTNNNLSSNENALLDTFGLHLEKGEPSSLLEVMMEEEEEQSSGSGSSEDSKNFDLVLKLDRDYTPKEIADYIFTTGDERGISQAITDMFQDGQLTPSKDDVIRFLEAVQEELGKLKNGFEKSNSNSNPDEPLSDDGIEQGLT